MTDDFEAIVIGAGMAGSCAAIRLAQAGVNTLLLERGSEAGAKNLSGGILWGNDLERILPGWQSEMPLERHVVRKRFGFLEKERAVSFVYSDMSWKSRPYVAHSVLRARTDAWLAKKAEEAGATVVTSVPVERLNWEGSRVHGVVQGGETMTAPVTVLCDGANSRLSLGTPIRPNARLSPSATEIGIKEVFQLPAEVIEERFQLAPGEGHAEEWVAGMLPPGVAGGGFLYTNAQTISLGLILNIGTMFGKGAYSPELMERFKLHPAIASRLKDAVLVEYGAKLISSGWASRPAAFSGDGWMVAGDAAGFVFSNGIVIQGMNYAVRTGLEAAEAAIAARSRNDFSGKSLGEYDTRLEKTGVLHDFREFEGLDRVKWNPRFYGGYPAMAGELMQRLLTAPEGEREPIYRLLESARRSAGLRAIELVKDSVDLFENL
ncbi:MAG: FAD-dependent oxidoreductase [Thermoplasmata archaeon]|nr:FAD-dependent oxidoreductase [Thermoplasmata archaeon]